MATRIAFSTHWPDRMGDLAGKPTCFPEKIIAGIDPYSEDNRVNQFIDRIRRGGVYAFDFRPQYSPKATTIRKNYAYWKAKEGQMIQPFFWAGKPYRSKQVVFCPEVRLKRVYSISILDRNATEFYVPLSLEANDYAIYVGRILYSEKRLTEVEDLVKSDGFDSPEHFFQWFDEDFEGALLVWGDQEY